MAKGNFGQGLTQTLTLTNQTARDFAFEMVAEDVIIKDGKRVFVPAGETPNSIAASAGRTCAPWWRCSAERTSCQLLRAPLA